MAARSAKWYRWLGSGGVSTFEGALYCAKDIYRPTESSKMRNLGSPFGPVNEEQFVLRIYSAVKPIDSATPAGTYRKSDVLSVTPIVPRTHSLLLQWYADGVLRASGYTQKSLQVASLGLSPGSHSVKVRVTDETAKVRNESERQRLMVEERTWTVQIDTIPGDANLDCKVNLMDMLFVRDRIGMAVGSGSNWQADVNRDGRIDMLDLLYIRDRVNNRCG